MAETEVSSGNVATNFQGKAKRKRMKKSHPGFESVQGSIAAREGIPMARAGAILAAATRRASPAAKKANPRLKRVKTKKAKKPQ